MCKYCEQVAFTNGFSGKQFFVNMEDVVKRGHGEICIAINNRGEYVLHYEDEKTPRPDLMNIKINFCPICGRKLTEEEDA